MFVQAFLPEPPIEAFHLGIVGRCAWPAEVELHAMFVRPPPQHRLGDADRATRLDMAIALIENQTGCLLLEFGGKRTTLLGLQTPLHCEHSRLCECPDLLDQYKPLLHVRPPLQKRALLTSRWTGLLGAGHNTSQMYANQSKYLFIFSYNPSRD